jgi:hypothetical protein
MGNTEFLVQSGLSKPSNLPEAISNLEDVSTLFMERWLQENYEHAGKASKEALQLFDFITNEMLREKVERKGAGTYQNSSFRHEMQKSCGCGVTNLNLQQQKAMVNAGPGNGRIETNLGNSAPLTLDRLLNKIKHRNSHLMNFRIENGRHIFLICPDHTEGGAEGIYEFDVIEFCELCKIAASTL